MAERGIERIGLTEELLDKVNVTEEDKRRMYSITPLGGRYDKYLGGFYSLTSDFELNKRRVWIEVEYLIALTDFIANSSTKKRKLAEKPFSERDQQELRSLYENFSEKDFAQIVLIETKTNHDIVAVVRWIDYRLGKVGYNLEELIHFGRTSADIDSNAYNSIVQDLVYSEYLPLVVKVQEKLIELSRKWGTVFAGQTHGQWAEYTTLKKVFANFVDGIRQSLEAFYVSDQKVRTIGKMGGAIGNNSDIIGAYPDLDWESFNHSFVEDVLGLEYFPMADQDSFNIRNNELFDAVTRVNDVLEKLSEDFWEYCSRGVLVKIPLANESGSSVMAQKANPWRIEGGWEYLADADFSKYHNLTKYKRQGDLRRKIRARTIGEPFAKCVIGLNRILEELCLYQPNLELIDEENNKNAGMSSAYIQTVLRREGTASAYDDLKKISMGKTVTFEEYASFVDGLVSAGTISTEVGEEIKLGMKPENNVGNANVLADQAIAIAEEQLRTLKKLK